MPTGSPLPYRLACLVDLRDHQGRVLLLRRSKAPNQGLCSPIGGKVDMAAGESPAACARRETLEEAGLDLPPERFHLGGLISETAYEGAGHWLMFYYRVLGPVSVAQQQIREGSLEWFDPSDIDALPLPETDRQVIWPLIRRHEPLHPRGRPGFFVVHIDCRHHAIDWTVQQELPPSHDPAAGH